MDAELFAALGPIFSGQAYPVTAPQGLVLSPYCVWFRSVSEGDFWCADANVSDVTVELYIYAKTYDHATTLAGQAMAALKTVAGYERGANEQNGFDPETEFFEWQLSANYTRVG